MMFKGETVCVLVPTIIGHDELGAAIEGAPEQIDVDHVLVKVGSASEPSAQNRPDGVVVHYTLYFPRSFTEDLTGCRVIVRGHTCKVVGHPDRYPESPNNWNMECEVSHVKG